MNSDLISRAELRRNLMIWADKLRTAGECGGCEVELLQAVVKMVDAQEIQSELRGRLIEVSEAMKQAEKHIEIYGETSLPVRQVIAEVKRIVNGNN